MRIKDFSGDNCVIISFCRGESKDSFRFSSCMNRKMSFFSGLSWSRSQRWRGQGEDQEEDEEPGQKDLWSETAGKKLPVGLYPRPRPRP